MKILSIDAWGNKKDGYEWNNWFHVGDISKERFEKLKTDNDYGDWFFYNGFTTTNDVGEYFIDDDQYNIIIGDKKTGCPIFAIEYGPEY